MSLLVTANRITRDSEGERIVRIETPSDLAGSEVTRTTFYGGAMARALGLTMLPRLATSDLYARGDELEVLRAEVHKMIANLSEKERIYWEFRLNNILRAIDVAAAHGEDGLVIID